jgi:hypothetical protein
MASHTKALKMTENYRSPTVCSCRHSRSSASVTKRVDCIADLAACRKVTTVIEPDCTKLAGKYVLKFSLNSTT